MQGACTFLCLQNIVLGTVDSFNHGEIKVHGKQK